MPASPTAVATGLYIALAGSNVKGCREAAGKPAPPAEAAVGNVLEVDIRGSKYPAKVVPLPFYKREKPAAKTGV